MSRPKKRYRVISFTWYSVWGEPLICYQYWMGKHMVAAGIYPRDENLHSNEKIDHQIASTAG